MKSWEYNAVVYDGEIFCTGCVPDDIQSEFVTPIFAYEILDSRPICSACGEPHEYMGLSLNAAQKEINPDAIQWD